MTASDRRFLNKEWRTDGLNIIQMPQRAAQNGSELQCGLNLQLQMSLFICLLHAVSKSEAFQKILKIFHEYIVELRQ